MEPRWDRPLDGLDEVPWDELLGPNDATELVSALRSLAAEGGNGDRIHDVLEDNDYHYWYATVSAKPEGFRPAAVPALRFLARIAAQPSGFGSQAALDLVETITDAALDRPTMTGVELDAMVDALRVELDAARPALAEASRLGRAGDDPARILLADVEAGVLLGGAYEPRWRGVARPLLDSPTGRLTVVGGMLVTREKSDLVFRSPHDGEPIHTFSYPGPEGAWPFAGSTSDSSVLFRKDNLWAHPFVDRDGPGVLTVDAGGRHPRLWRPVGDDWRATRLVRPGPRLRPSSWRALTVAPYGGECFVGYADGVVLRFDARTGVPSGRPISLTGNSAMLGVDDDLLMVARRTPEGERHLIRIALATGRPVDPLFRASLVSPVRYVAEGRPRLAFVDGSGPDRGLYRFDAETGVEIGSPIRIGDLHGFCVYEPGDRSCLAVAGYRQVHRLDAQTGEPVGPPLFGHRRIVRDVASATVDGRTVLYSADGATVRRWDAETGSPWPAAVPS
jgi:hypothetical protein